MRAKITCGHLKLFQIPTLLTAIIIVSIFTVRIAHGAKILFFIGASSPSHRIAMQPLATKLSEISHDVTFLSPIKPEVENHKIKEFCPQGLLDMNKKFNQDFGGAVVNRLNDKYFDPFWVGFGDFLWGLCYDFHLATVSSPDFQDWMNNESFDLVISEHPCKEVALGIAHKFRAKHIAFLTAPPTIVDADMFGWPTEASWLPETTMGSRYSFIPDRFSYEYNMITWYLTYRYRYLPRMDALFKDIFPGDIMPPAEDLLKRINLYMVNIHFSNDYARSLPPFAVPVGGMHIQETRKPLLKEIEKFIQAGDKKEGFVYISFGSIVKVSAFPQGLRNEFFAAIASFPKVKFLLKWEGEFPQDLPKNVFPWKWFPQQDVLAHPKCRGFVTQGGQMSFQQAAAHGVPVIVVPIFADQPFNAKLGVHHGNGIHLELADLSQETFSHAIRELLYNKAYFTKAKEVAMRFKDRPMSPVDTAVWWTEYVLRHNDSFYLKPLGIRQEWWERRLLDFWALVFTLIFLVFSAIIFMIYEILKVFKKFKNCLSSEKLKKS